MTSKLTREWLQHQISAIEVVGITDSNTLLAFKLALAAIDSEPVAYADPQSFDNFKSNGGENAACTKEWMWRDHSAGLIPLYRHAQPALVIPSELHPDTQKLAIDFCTALAEKLYKAQLKYGYDADWKQDGWPSQCQAHFHQHIAKGDPRDVAAYCAFMWYHGWKTQAAQPAPVVTFYRDGIEAAAKWIDQQREAYDSEHGWSDPDTGAFEFGNDAQREYSSTLEELAEGIRGLHPNAGNSPVIPDGSASMLQRWLAFGRGMQNAGSQLPRNLIAETESMLAAAPQEPKS